MNVDSKGYFVVGELTDGRFAAASSSPPYFCFRADSEEAVIAKAQKALAFYAASIGVGNSVKIKSVTQTVTTLRPTKRIAFHAPQLEAA
jgi:predicted RNase H-like HicB family nuclease